MYMGNDPRVFQLYFVCNFLYGYYNLERRKDRENRYHNYGCVWSVLADDVLNRTKIRCFMKRMFNGLILTDCFEDLYAFCLLECGISYKIPINAVEYFYFVESYGENGERLLYLHKYSFLSKCNSFFK